MRIKSHVTPTYHVCHIQHAAALSWVPKWVFNYIEGKDNCGIFQLGRGHKNLCNPECLSFCLNWCRAQIGAWSPRRKRTKLCVVMAGYTHEGMTGSRRKGLHRELCNIATFPVAAHSEP